MKALITGGAGFIGSHLADHLIAKGNKVVIIDNLSSGALKHINKKAVFHKMDVGDARIAKVFKKEKPDVVFHFAAKINVTESIHDPVRDGKTNILGSINVLENCARGNVKKVILSSTVGIYGETRAIPTRESHPANPISPYGLAKLTTEYYLRYYQDIFKIPSVSLRFANVYGPRQGFGNESGVVSVFCHNALLGKDIPVNGDGRQTRDFVFIKDVVAACLLAMKSRQTGVFNIGTGAETSINRLFEIIKKESNSSSKKTHNRGKEGGQRRSSLSYGKAKKLLGWQPKYDLGHGIAKTLAWHRLRALSGKH